MADKKWANPVRSQMGGKAPSMTNPNGVFDHNPCPVQQASRCWQRWDPGEVHGNRQRPRLPLPRGWHEDRPVEYGRALRAVRSGSGAPDPEGVAARQPREVIWLGEDGRRPDRPRRQDPLGSDREGSGFGRAGSWRPPRSGAAASGGRGAGWYRGPAPRASPGTLRAPGGTRRRETPGQPQRPATRDPVRPARRDADGTQPHYREETAPVPRLG